MVVLINCYFYGYGVFFEDGFFLFIIENDFENVEGCIGVWDVFDGFCCIGEFVFGGVGFYDI